MTKEWVIIAPERAKRPDQFRSKEEKKAVAEHDPNCPFCFGNEAQTPPAVYEVKSDGKWLHRVVPNKFAAVSDEHSCVRRQAGKYLTADGFGIAEVVIETPYHNRPLTHLSHIEMRGVIETYRQRYIELAKDGRIDLITIFKNHGPRAGTSLEHPHSQIIATGMIPVHVRYPLQQALIHHDTFGECPFCVLIKDEINDKVRVIMDEKHFVAYCPFASKSPFEIRIMPKRHCSQFSCIDGEEADEFAFILQTILKKIYRGLGDPDLNYVIESMPISDGETHYFHWHLNIVPKLTTPAGFEIGTGIYINIMPPEEAASYMRGFKTD